MAIGMAIKSGARSSRLVADVAGNQVKFTVIVPPNIRQDILIPLDREEDIIDFFRRAFAATRSANSLTPRPPNDV